MVYPGYNCPNCGHVEMADPLELNRAFRGPYIWKECDWDTREPIPNGNVTLKQQRDQKQTEDMINVFSYGIQSIIDSFITLLNILGWVIKNPIKSGFLLIYQLPGYVILEVDDNKTGNFFSLYFSYKALFWFQVASGWFLWYVFYFTRFLSFCARVMRVKREK